MIDRRQWLPIVVDGLPDQQRLIITALHFEGLSEREVGERLGLHHSTVQEHRDHALVTMRAYYAALEEFLAQST